jgi:hypothetical protein
MCRIQREGQHRWRVHGAMTDARRSSGTGARHGSAPALARSNCTQLKPSSLNALKRSRRDGRLEYTLSKMPGCHWLIAGIVPRLRSIRDSMGIEWSSSAWNSTRSLDHQSVHLTRSPDTKPQSGGVRRSTSKTACRSPGHQASRPCLPLSTASRSPYVDWYRFGARR